MKRRLLLPLILLSFFTIANCQVYLDSLYNEVDKNQAAYYQVTEKINSNDFVIKTFLINDTLIEVEHLKSIKTQIKDGKCFRYYPNGKLHYSENYANGELTGEAKGYYENGKFHYSENYIDGKLNGESKTYFENGELHYSMVYIDGMLNGELKGYFENGNLRRQDHYKNDILIDGKCFTQTGQDTTYYIYEKSASFKNGDVNNFRKFVQQLVIYPEYAAENGIQGKVIIQFTVNSDGEVVDVKVLRSPHVLLSISAVEAILKSDLWEPAIQEGQKVEQQFVIPVMYSLQ